MLPNAFAERPAAPELFPDNTVLLIRLPDVNTLKGDFQKTAFGQMLRDNSVQPTVTELWQHTKKTVASVEERFGTTVEEVLAIPTGEVAFGIVPVPLADPAFALLADVGKRPDVLRNLMEQAEEAMLARGSDFSTQTFEGTDVSTFKTIRNEKTRRLIFFERDGAFCVASHEYAIEQIIRNWNIATGTKTASENKPEQDTETANTETTNTELAKNDDNGAAKKTPRPLARQGIFKSTMRHVRSGDAHQPQLLGFVDVIGFAKAATRGNFAANAAMAMLPVVGLDKLKAVGFSWTLVHDDFDSLMHGHVLLDGPRTGVLDMVALKKTQLAPTAWVPADALSYTSLRWDIPQTLSALDQMLDQLKGKGTLDNWLTSTFSEPLGVDIEKEFLEELTGRLIVVEWMEPPLRLNSQSSLFALQVRDEERFDTTLAKIVAKLGDRLKPVKIGNLTAFHVLPKPDDEESDETIETKNDEDSRKRRRRGRRGVSFRGGMPADATFILFDDFFVFADRPGILDKILETEDFRNSLSKSKSFDEATDFAIKMRGGKNAGLFKFYDSEWVYRHRYALITAPENVQMITDRVGNNEFMKGVMRILQDHPLPPFEALQRYFAQTGATVIADEESGLHMASFLLKRKADRSSNSSD